MILGVLTQFNPDHPLWHSFAGLETEWPTRVQSGPEIGPIPPDLIITDRPDLDWPDGPVLYYLTDQSLDIIQGGDRASVAALFGRAAECLAPTVPIAQAARSITGADCKVCCPYVADFKAVPEVVVYDQGHPYAAPLQAALPRERFVPYEGPEDLSRAKAFLPLRQGFDYRLCKAVVGRVPVIGFEAGHSTDVAPGTFLPVNAPISRWEQAVRGALRDRPVRSGKPWPADNRYRNMAEFNEHVRKTLRNRLTRPPAKSPSFAEIQRSPDPGYPTARHRLGVRPLPPPPPPNTAPARSIVLTGGVGDIFALESYMTDAQREAVTTICWATNKRKIIQPLFEGLPSFPNLKDNLVVWDDFDKFWCFLSKNECRQRLTDPPAPFEAAEDWSIVPKFDQFRRSGARSTYSSFLRYRLADVSGLCLPVRYVVICPYSTDKRMQSRDFDDADWAATLYWLVKRETVGVVLNTGTDFVPKTGSLLDLSNGTTLAQAVEVLKGSRGYIGIDSSLSVLAAKLFEFPNLMIKSKNSHCYNNKSIYYAPQKRFDFLKHTIVELATQKGS